MHLLDNHQTGDGLPVAGLKEASSVPQILIEGNSAAASMDHLDALEAQSIYILREAFARLKKLALLWSLGKDSNVMIWLARKAFFGRVPFPALHVDTGKKFPEMYAFRDRYSKEWDIDLAVEPCPPIDAVDPTLPPAARSAARKTEGLKLALAKYGFRWPDRRHPPRRRGHPRQGTRVLAARRRRRMGRARPAAGILGSVQRLAATGRASARSSDPALDRGRHLGLHQAREHPIIPLYLAKDGKRYRSLGDADITFPIASSASDIDEILTELELTKVPERAGRALDHETEDAFERLRAAGYL